MTRHWKELHIFEEPVLTDNAGQPNYVSKNHDKDYSIMTNYPQDDQNAQIDDVLKKYVTINND